MQAPFDFACRIREFNMAGRFSLTFHHFDEECFQTVQSALCHALARTDQLFLFDHLGTILHELVVNAQKANEKRLYFSKLGLDIGQPEDYRKGMESFKGFLNSRASDIHSELEAVGFSVTFGMERTPDDLVFSVRNSAEIVPQEEERIRSRFESARRFDDFFQAYQELYSSEEGAGLGIVLISILMKHMNLKPDRLEIRKDGGATQCLLHVPSDLFPRESTTQVKSRILSEVNNLPSFPKQVLRILEICRNPNSDIRAIGKQIGNDPALSADLLRLANSALFTRNTRIEHIATAVHAVGLKSLEALLLAVSSKKILSTRYSHFEKVWSHCRETSIFARIIAQELGRGDLQDFVSLSGLLHDLGKIILLSVDEQATESISRILQKRDIQGALLEEVAIGISHSRIGAILAEKWNFPQYLIESIRFHHTPVRASKEWMDIVCITYLANTMTNGFKPFSCCNCYREVVQHFQAVGDELIDRVTARRDKLRQEEGGAGSTELSD